MCHVTFFYKKISRIFTFGSVFKGFYDIVFGKILLSRHWGGKHGAMKQNDT